MHTAGWISQNHTRSAKARLIRCGRRETPSFCVHPAILFDGHGEGSTVAIPAIRTAVQLYRKGYTQQEIADKRGVSYGAIGQSPKSSFAQLEKALM